MASRFRPRRSVLYMPGSNARALTKGQSLPADGLILDLEDAVAPESKAHARAQVVAAVQGGGYGRRELLVRVNGLATPWGFEDLVAAATSGAHGVLLPKVEGPDQVLQAEAVLRDAGASEDLALWCMMEAPRGVLNAHRTADASRRLAGFVMGTSDLTKDLQARHTRDRAPMMTAFGLCLLAARAAGLAILDGVHLDLGDADGFTDACRQGRDLGFDGKTLIHPKQIATANTVFAPTDDEVAWSRRIIKAHAEAMAQGEGIVLVDGRLIENLHVDAARHVVALGEAIADGELPAAGPAQS